MTEISLLLDSDGRTTYDPSILSAIAVASQGTKTNTNTTTTTMTTITTEEADDDYRVAPNKRAAGEDDPACRGHRARSSSLDYSSKTSLTNLVAAIESSSSSSWTTTTTTTMTEKNGGGGRISAYDELLLDCEIADCGMMPRTFWVDAHPSSSPGGDDDDDDDDVDNHHHRHRTPRCFLERLAMEVFHRHVPPGHQYDRRTSGAEWWVQIRPSPPGTGRYSMLSIPPSSSSSSSSDGDDMAYDSAGMPFHWDKDEELWKMSDGSIYVHPHISTVTYLTDIGAPTMVLSRRVEATTGRYVNDGDDDDDDDASSSTKKKKTTAGGVEGFVSWPRRGKHLSFDGRMLHAAPSNIMGEGSFERLCDHVDGAIATSSDAAYADDDDDLSRTNKILTRRRRRVTFLVNVWLNYRPYGVKPFPDGMIGKLSKCDLFGEDFDLFYDDGTDVVHESAPTRVIVRGGRASVESGMTLTSADAIGSNDNDSGGREVYRHNNDDDWIKLTKMVWPMGGGKEDGMIEALVPLDLIRTKGETKGSDVAITWIDGFVLGGVGA